LLPEVYRDQKFTYSETSNVAEEKSNPMSQNPFHVAIYVQDIPPAVERDKKILGFAAVISWERYPLLKEVDVQTAVDPYLRAFLGQQQRSRELPVQAVGAPAEACGAPTCCGQ
jgi:hypothetical protein